MVKVLILDWWGEASILHCPAVMLFTHREANGVANQLDDRIIVLFPSNDPKMNNLLNAEQMCSEFHRFLKSRNGSGYAVSSCPS